MQEGLRRENEPIGDLERGIFLQCALSMKMTVFCVINQIWVELLTGRAKREIFFTSQKYYPDMSKDTSSVWNFCARSYYAVQGGS